MPNFRDMLDILNRRLDEIAVSPDLQPPRPKVKIRSGASKLAPDKEAQRILPLLVSRGAVEDFMSLGMSDREANEVLERLVLGTADLTNPALLTYVSNTELNALMLMAAKVLKWAGSNARRMGDERTVARFRRSAEIMFDAAKRAQQNAANSPPS